MAENDGTFTRRRDHTIDMPQMAVGGLSESWLFKELGDFHWSMLTEGLGMPSAQMLDGLGERLYATFTRIRIETAPLRDYAENAPLALTAQMERYGAGMFLSAIAGVSDDRRLTATLLSSFSRRGAPGSNRGLQKGQPTIPPDCSIPAATEKPAFAAEYGEVRRAGLPDNAARRVDYGIDPYRDINGVGLVYFAAFPAIADSCELALMDRGPRWAFEASTVSRDVFYFSNANPEDALEFRRLEERRADDAFHTRDVLHNCASGQAMALIRTAKRLGDG